MRSQKCKHCTAVIEIAKPGGIHMQLDLPRSNFWSPTPNILALGWGFWEMVEPWATPHNKNGILGPRERDQWLKALTENLGLVFSTHMVTHNYPETPVPSNDLLRHQAGMWCIYMYIPQKPGQDFWDTDPMGLWNCNWKHPKLSSPRVRPQTFM